MRSDQSKDTNSRETTANGGTVAAPSIVLPKGGGAIRGIGEKFAANPVTGTGSMTVPIATSPGRSGFGPQLALSYDSGAGNGPFGFGWNLSLPSITRKTDKGLPHYCDAEESDIFMLSGAEDLVPVLVEVDGQWQRETLEPRAVNQQVYQIQRYRPRIEGLFARIERWTNKNDPRDVRWRSISKDNITTWYGRTEESRICDPADPTHIFSWLISESYDDKGNLIAYGYKREDDVEVNLGQANECNRVRVANRYPKRIRYGNHAPYFPVLSTHDPWPALPSDDRWYFEVIFDYGEHDSANPMPHHTAAWAARSDPFSSFRAGFEVRTYRLCQRVLMFHHFLDEPDMGADCLVRSTDFSYSYEEHPTDARDPIFSLLLSATQSGYKRRPDGTYVTKSLPPLQFVYSQATIDEQIREIDPGSLENLPIGLDGAAYHWIDLDGEGLSGILTEQGGGWFYKRNLSANNQVLDNGSTHTAARFGPAEVVATKPALSLSTSQAQFLDLAADGHESSRI